MTSSDEGFRVLSGWKRRGAALHMKLLIQSEVSRHK
jgi:hypothetical protein